MFKGEEGRALPPASDLTWKFARHPNFYLTLHLLGLSYRESRQDIAAGMLMDTS